MLRRVLGALLISAIAVAGLAGCRQQYDEAAQWLDRQPGVESVEDRGNPIEGFLSWDYAGDIRGHLAEDATDEQLIELADAAAAFLEKNDSKVELRFELARGPYVFQVQSEHDANVALVEELNGFAEDEQITAVRLLPDFTHLIGARENATEIFARYAPEISLLVTDSEDQETASLRFGQECGRKSGELKLLDSVLSTTDYLLAGDPCREWTIDVAADQVLASLDDLHERWVVADEPPVDIVVAAHVGEDDVRHYGYEREIKLTGLDGSLLEFARSLAESEDLGDTAFRLSSNGLSMDDVDDTLCEQLAAVRDAEGFDHVPTLEIAKWGDDEDRSSVDGSREKVVAYLDDLGAGCRVDGEVHLGG